MASLDLNGAYWHRSSYSNQAGGDCVEVAGLDLNHVTWRKSSHSNQEGGNCVEVGNMARVIPVRDSKYPDGPVLVFAAASWTAFVRELKTDRRL